jgi:hypothetical protein
MAKRELYTFSKVWKTLKMPPYSWKCKRPHRKDLSNDWLYYSDEVTLRGEPMVVEWAISNQIFDKRSEVLNKVMPINQVCFISTLTDEVAAGCSSRTIDSIIQWLGLGCARSSNHGRK